MILLPIGYLVIQLNNDDIKTILRTVNIKRYKSIHYLLIILLMCAPFRTVMALDTEQCHSKDAISSISNHMDSMSSHDAMQHEGHQMMMSGDTGTELSQQCCCDVDSSCASNCEIGMMVSLVVQQSLYSPVYIDVSDATMVSASLLLREITPPSRPPARLS